MKSDYSLNLTYKFLALQNLQITFSRENFKRLHVESESVWCLLFQEEYLNMGWYGNLDSSMDKNARLDIWTSVVQIPDKVQIFLLKIYSKEL